MTDRRLVAGVVIAACVHLYMFSLFQLSSSAGGVTQQYYPGDTPVAVLSPPGDIRGTVVIAHGFAANAGMMKPMGYYLAQQGYRVVLFDFPGYGNSRLKVNETSMYDTLELVTARYAGEGYSLAGHSLGSYAALDYGMHGHGDAVIGLSSFYSDVERTRPRNMLLIAGTSDLATVVPSLPAAVANGTGVAAPQEGVKYGNFSDGTARMYEYVDANHITILFNNEAWQDTLRWLDSTYGYARAPHPSLQGLSLPWAFIAIGTVLVAFVPGLFLLSRLVTSPGRPPGPAASRPLLKALLIAFAGSLAAAVAVTVFNPARYTGLMMADLLVGFLLYAGIFTMVIDYLAYRPATPGYTPGHLARSLAVALIAGLLLVAAIAIPVDMAFYEQPVTIGRLSLMAAVALLTLPFFVAGDLLARGNDTARSLAVGAGIRIIALGVAALAFVISGNTFFVFVIMPVVLPLFLGLEIVSHYAHRWTGSVFAGAFLNALITGWLLASAFPVA
ncbi:MAG: Alpha/beta hydrolase family protein [Methanocella sp. PtaU1.Bin125]|nr:MAG: Alpha/beta hydrolase family protein [Methanocella sp. PtaU1.Bin125]